MYNEIITLVGAAKTTDAYGDIVEEPTEVEVFAQVRSVGSKRKLEAAAVGLKLEWKFVLADYYDYSGQEKLRYEDELFHVVDTYRTAEGGIELTVTRC